MLETFALVYVAFITLVTIVLLAISLRKQKIVHYRANKNYNPRVLVIIPCKGSDIGLKRNLKAAMDQDYKNYDAIAVVDSKLDPAMKAIRSAGMRFIISNATCRSCSGKVRAIASAVLSMRDYDAYVIVDSDVLTKSYWLERLIAPLSDRRVGISTSFPIFRPIGGFWSWVKFVWGFVGMSLMESDATRFAWGGSMAFRKDLLSNKTMKEFIESVSDDIAITNMAKKRKLMLAYVADAMPVVESNDSFAQFSEWSVRQTSLSITGNRRLFYYGVVFYLASILVLLSAITLSISVNAIFLLLLLPLIAGMAKTYFRSKGSVIAVLIFPLINFIYLWNMIKANSISQITWRGRVYNLK